MESLFPSLRVTRTKNVNTTTLRAAKVIVTLSYKRDSCYWLLDMKALLMILKDCHSIN